MNTLGKRLGASCAALALILATFSSPSFAERPKWAQKAAEDIVTFAANASGGTDDLDADGTDFDILIQALLYTGVIGIFDGTDYTVFAPNDQAFYNLTNTSDDTAALNAVLGLLSQEQIEGVLAYHVTDGVRNSRSVTRAKQLVMLDGNSISYMNNLIVANESEAGLLSIDNRLSDGMVHVIDTVLLAAPLPSP